LITTLDTLSWGQELVTGNAEFVETPSTPTGTLYVVSNVRELGGGFGVGFGYNFGNTTPSVTSFEVLESTAVPPAPGPGSTFITRASYTFPQPNIDFDPVVALDLTATPNPVLHILGTRNTPTGANTSSSQLSDIIKFTFDTVTGILTGPVVVAASVGTRIRSSYDICVLPTHDTMVAMSLTDPNPTFPIPDYLTITSVGADNGTVTITLSSNTFLAGQWVLLDELTTATFLNGQVLQVVEATATYFTAYLNTPNYPVTADTGVVEPVGSSLFAVELDGTTNLPVANTATILASSPSRSGNTFDGVSLLAIGPSIELYYQSHPKVFTFADQVFTINVIGYDYPAGGFGNNFGFNFGINNPGFGFNFGFDFGNSFSGWSDSQVLTTFTARYSDNRLTVLTDILGNRYMSLTYWSQLNHPEGIVGSVLVGTNQGSGWFFHPTLGTTMGGSIVQSTLSISENKNVSLVYLLQPFVPVQNPPLPSTAAWPLQVANVDPTTLGLTNVPGFYNTLNFTWLRGTKSLMDNTSSWGVVGEREITTLASNELHVIPALSVPPVPFTVQTNAGPYFEDAGVVYFPSLIPLVEVDTNPQKGQYTVDTTTGVYTFSQADAGLGVAISYEYVSAILPVYASLFNVPPIAELTPTTITLWRDTTFYATDVSEVSSFSVTNNVVTVIAPNDFVAGDAVAIYGFQAPANQFLNGNTLTVLPTGLSSSQFEANFNHANYTFTPTTGFGSEFGISFNNGGVDAGFAAVLIPGPLTLSACGSFSPNFDPLTYVWTDNSTNQADVTLTTNGCSAIVTVNPLIGGAAEEFNVGVAVEDLTSNPPHVALVPTSFSTSGNNVTFVVPNDLITGEQVMPYDIALAPPPAPDAGYGLSGFGYDFGFNFAGGTTYYFEITYVNAQGETTVSAETAATVPPSSTPAILSPPANGDATGYNVYMSTVSGGEQLQFNSAGNLAPTPIGTTWVMAAGPILMGTNPPTTNTAFESFLNDIDLTVESANSTEFTATPNALSGLTGFGFDFGSSFGTAVGGITFPTFPTTFVVGFLMPQFQFQIATIIVPENVAPTITFPTPYWNAANPPSEPYPFADVARNSLITITPNYPVGAVWSNTTVYEIGTTVDYLGTSYTSIQDNNVGNNPATSPLFWGVAIYPVVYTGLTDPDDTPTYLWAQVSGTPVTIVGPLTSNSLQFTTNGVNVNGEPLVFSLTVSDGVNPPVTAYFTANVAAYSFNSNNQDFLQLSRSIYSSAATVTEVSIFEGIGEITANNTFTAGQTVFFENMTNATFLNGAYFTILPTGFGQSFGAGFGGNSDSPTEFIIVDDSLPNFTGSDTGTAYAASSISQRNAQKGWSPLDISILFNNLRSVKRTSVLDGSDRYIVISRYSVLVYGVFPDTAPASVLLRKIFLPNNAQILDAVHTEQDYTLVLDTDGNIWRYSTSPFINTDDPDTQIVIANYTSLSFADTDQANDVKILTTVSFGNQRVVVLTGEQGCVLLQMNTTTLAVTGTLTFDVVSNNLYGASKIQFVRWVNMDNLQSGRILLGSILNQSANVTSVAISAGSFNGAPVTTDNTLVITGANSFSAGDVIVFSGMTHAAFLNGATVTVIAATPTQFIGSYEVPAPTWSATQTYVQGQVVGAGNPVTASYIALANVNPNLGHNPTSSPSFWALYTGVYGPTGETVVGNSLPLAQSQNSGSTYETLIDLAANQIIGTFDKSKLKNQFVETGEILFDPDSTYAGGPTPPQLLIPRETFIGGQPFVQISWQQNRPDLITSYTVQYAVENPIATTVPATAPYTFQSPALDQFTADEGVFDVTQGFALTSVASLTPFPGQYNVTSQGFYTFNAAQAGHNLVLTIREGFQNLETVNSGNVQTIYVPLPAGRTYFFQVQASGLDGTSGFSNIQSITI
jgi:hypothetical protein